jgi:hypothetical protein
MNSLGLMFARCQLGKGGLCDTRSSAILLRTILGKSVTPNNKRRSL